MLYPAATLDKGEQTHQLTVSVSDGTSNTLRSGGRGVGRESEISKISFTGTLASLFWICKTREDVEQINHLERESKKQKGIFLVSPFAIYLHG